MSLEHDQLRKEKWENKRRYGKCIEDDCEEPVACNHCKKCQEHHDQEPDVRKFY